jgi:hypothetical protein
MGECEMLPVVNRPQKEIFSHVLLPAIGGDVRYSYRPYQRWPLWGGRIVL